MLAPRRIGKTVLLNNLRDQASSHGYRSIVLDVEGFRDEKDFFRQCCSAIQEELTTGSKVMTTFVNKLKNVFGSGEIESGDWRQWLLQTDWKEFSDQLFGHLNNDEGSPWIILVDELPVFVQALQEKSGPEALTGFLYWLRRMRQKHKNIRWLYTGSVGLDTVARRNNIEGALNDLHPFTLNPFEVETATEFLKRIAERRKCQINDEATKKVISRLGWLSPYYLERIVEDACTYANADTEISVDQVDQAMDRLLELPKRLYWVGWREHLDRNIPEPERSRLYWILAKVARDENGTSYDTLLSAAAELAGDIGGAEIRDSLDTLISDGYLTVNDNGRYIFMMHLLREWWLRYVVL